MRATNKTQIRGKERTKKITRWILIGLLFISGYLFFKFFNPYEVDFFPKCPFLYLTGYKCPGCGSQRAIYYLFNFDIIHAARENLLLVVSIPYLIVGAWLDTIKVKTERQLKFRKLLFGKGAIKLILILVIGFWVLRNILV